MEFSIDLSRRGILAGGLARFLAIDATGLAIQVAAHHGLKGAALRLAADATVATALLSATIKGEERITLQIQAERPRMAFLADIDADGGFRGRLTPPHLPDALPDGRIDGMMLAIKSDVQRELYRGVTEVKRQTLAEGLGHHLATSDQLGAVLVIASNTHEDGIERAMGLLVEPLPAPPGLSEEDEAELRQRIQDLVQRPIDELLAGLPDSLGPLAAEVLEDRVLHWRCSCSQERTEAVLRSLGPSELSSLRAEQGKAEVTCHFCNLTYTVSGTRLDELAAELRGPVPEA